MERREWWQRPAAVIASQCGWAEGDWDGNADFTSADLILALADGGYEAGPRRAAVPEPSAVVLLLFGGLGIARQCGRF